LGNSNDKEKRTHKRARSTINDEIEDKPQVLNWSKPILPLTPTKYISQKINNKVKSQNCSKSENLLLKSMNIPKDNKLTINFDFGLEEYNIISGSPIITPTSIKEKMFDFSKNKVNEAKIYNTEKANKIVNKTTASKNTKAKYNKVIYFKDEKYIKVKRIIKIIIC